MTPPLMNHSSISRQPPTPVQRCIKYVRRLARVAKDMFAPASELMIQRQFKSTPWTIQPLRRGVIRRSEIGFVEDVEGTRRNAGVGACIPEQSQVSGGIRGQLQAVGIVGITLAYVAPACHGRPARTEVPADPYVGQPLRHIGRH